MVLPLKSSHQGQVTELGFSDILGIANVRINTQIESTACVQPEISKRHRKTVYDLEFQGRTFEIRIHYFNMFDIPGIDTNIMFVWC